MCIIFNICMHSNTTLQFIILVNSKNIRLLILY